MNRNSQNGKDTAMSRLANIGAGPQQPNVNPANRTQVFGPEFSAKLSATLANEADIPTRENHIIGEAGAPPRYERRPVSDGRRRINRVALAATAVVVPLALAAGLLSADRSPRATAVAPAEAAPSPTYEPTTTSTPPTTLQLVRPVPTLERPPVTSSTIAATTTTAPSRLAELAENPNIPPSVIATLEAVQALQDSLQATTSTVAQTTTSLAPTTTIRPTTPTTALSPPVSSTVTAR